MTPTSVSPWSHPNVECSGCGWRGFRYAHPHNPTPITDKPCPRCGGRVRLLRREVTR